MKRTRVVSFCLALVFAATVAFASSSAAPGTKYSVYCANGKIEIDSRDMDQMKSARGSDVCKFGEFDYLSDAQSFAKQFGGEGASCKCK